MKTILHGVLVLLGLAASLGAQRIVATCDTTDFA